MTDANRQVVWAASYEPFGKPRIATELVINNFRFPGQYEDREASLTNNWKRYYKAPLGRYAEADPAGILPFKIPGVGHPLAGYNHLYSYASNNPLIYGDRDGGNPAAGVLVCIAQPWTCPVVIPLVAVTAVVCTVVVTSDTPIDPCDAPFQACLAHPWQPPWNPDLLT